MAKKLNTTSEWEQIVNENHRRVADAEFQQDVEYLNRILHEDTSGKNRRALAMKMDANRPGKLAKLAMACCMTAIMVAGAVNLEMYVEDQNLPWGLIVMIAMAVGVVTGICLMRKGS